MSKVIHFSSKPFESSTRHLAELPNRVVEGDPIHETHMHFESLDGKLSAGSWTSTPGKWHAFINRDEFCTILDGKGELISSSGEVVSFKKGDSFLIPDGFRGYWHILETTTKHFVIRQY